MMRSMFSAVSALRAHQLKMDVIGNNIANVNTVGFKGTRVTFQEVFSQTLRGGGRPQENGRGGTNPQQVGLGISVASMDTFHTRGASERTDYNSDAMINGEGFFIVSDTRDGANKNYTRAGMFGLDSEGNLVTPEGYYVLGYVYDADKNEYIEDLTSLQISKAMTSPPEATDRVNFEGNIDMRLEDGKSFDTTMKVYDSLGNIHEIGVTFIKNGDNNREFKVKFSYDGETNEDVTIKFTSEGKIESITGTDVDADGLFQLKISDGSLSGGGDELKNAKALDMTIDFTKITGFSEDSNVGVKGKTGRSSGKLDDFTISANGEIEGTFSNGDQRILGKLRLANFRNTAGLLKTGSNMYRETANSGEPIYGDPGAGGFGNLQNGNLEMSNVDLSNEFTNMITTQRGFQANSRIITTSDEMLQEVVNMKR